MYLTFVFAVNIPIFAPVVNQTEQVTHSQQEIVQEEEDPSKRIITKEDVKEYIKEYSEEYGVDSDLALNIAKCESEYYYEAQNPDSSAEGVFQMIDSTWEYTMEMMDMPTTTSKISVPESIEAGVYLLSKEGSSHWDASKNCWSKLTMN